MTWKRTHTCILPSFCLFPVMTHLGVWLKILEPTPNCHLANFCPDLLALKSSCSTRTLESKPAFFQHHMRVFASQQIWRVFVPPLTAFSAPSFSSAWFPILPAMVLICHSIQSSGFLHSLEFSLAKKRKKSVILHTKHKVLSACQAGSDVYFRNRRKK